jgi:hypothetical protein
MTVTGKTGSAQKKTLSQWQFVHQKSHMDRPEVWPSTHRLNHPGTTVWGRMGTSVGKRA